MTVLQQTRHLLLLATSIWLVQISVCTPTDPVVSVLTPTSTTYRSDFIPFDKWHCGAGDFDKHLSHQLSESECPARMYEANLCCLAHDLCYVEEDKTQEHCDSAFCFCLNRTLSMPNTNHTLGCTNVAEGFCDIVQIFGAAAHSSAKKEQTTTTTTPATPSTTTTTTSSPITTSSPADIVKFVTHNVSLHCFSHELGNCLEELHTCVLTHTQRQQVDSSSKSDAMPLWPDCSQHFCTCVSAKPSLSKLEFHEQQQDKQCEKSLQMVCKQLQTSDKPADPAVHVNIQLWTTTVNYLGGTGAGSVITLWLLALVSLLTLAVLICVLLKCYTSYKAHSTEGYGISGAAEFVSRARRHTLRKEDSNQEPAYKCFHDEDKSCLPQRLHTRDHLLPMNSSKAQLILQDSNSTSTPSIDSAA